MMKCCLPCGICLVMRLSYWSRTRVFFACCLKNDPQRKNAWFLSKVDRGIYEVFNMGMCERVNAGLLFFEKLCQMSGMQSKATTRHKYLGSDKWRALNQQNIILVERKSNIDRNKKIDRGVRTNESGTVLFDAARNLFPDYIPELNISESKQSVSDVEDRMEPAVLKGEIISNIGGKSRLNDNNGIYMTVAESLDLSLDAFSINISVGWHK